MKKLVTEPKNTPSMKKVEQANVVKTFGQRMREAREMTNITQQCAAKLLGYSNSSKLAKIENATDTNSVPLWLIPKAAEVYMVSVDFLFGISDDWERDPTVSNQREMEHWLLQHWERARAAELNAIRVLSNRLVTIEKAVSKGLKRALDLKTLVGKFSELNKDFGDIDYPVKGYDDLRLANKLLAFAIETVEEANGISAELKRYHCSVELADKVANVGLKAKDFDRLANRDIFE